jgi:hypothetical protein
LASHSRAEAKLALPSGEPLEDSKASCEQKNATFDRTLDTEEKVFSSLIYYFRAFLQIFCFLVELLQAFLGSGQSPVQNGIIWQTQKQSLKKHQKENLI